MITAKEIFGTLQLLDTPRRVLIIEDQVTWLNTLTTILEAQGHAVTPMTGVLAVGCDVIEGLDQYGKPFEPSPQAAEIDAVFLDYNFAGGKHNGASFLREFRLHSNSPVLGMSSDRGLNSVLDALGATMSMQKHRLKSLLLEHNSYGVT